jgi:hypothetical protein
LKLTDKHADAFLFNVVQQRVQQRCCHTRCLLTSNAGRYYLDGAGLGAGQTVFVALKLIPIKLKLAVDVLQLVVVLVFVVVVTLPLAVVVLVDALKFTLALPETGRPPLPLLPREALFI